MGYDPGQTAGERAREASKSNRSHVLVVNGQVMAAESWCHYNGTDWGVTTLRRRGENFEFSSHTPEGGGPARTETSVKAAMLGMHEKVVCNYEALFSLRSPKPDDLNQLQFHNHELIQ